MSEESAQLSVAELLARNGQDVPTGGGRRRRGGRGISVNELTGDLPAVREGSSAHAAPDPEAEDTTAGPSDGPAYSPQSGPISFYDPLGTHGVQGEDSGVQGGYAPSSSAPPSSGPAPSGPPAYEPPAYRSPAMSDAVLRGRPEYGAPGPAEPDADRDPFAGPDGVQPAANGRRARRERMEAMEASAAAPAPPGTPDQAPGAYPPPSRGMGPAPWAPARAPEGEPWPQRPGAGGPPAGGLPAWSARNRQPPGPPAAYADPERGGAPAPGGANGAPRAPGVNGAPAPPGANGAPAPPGANGAALPSRRANGAPPAWPPTGQGQPVGGPPLGARRPAPAPVEALTDVYEPVQPGDFDSDLGLDPEAAADLDELEDLDDLDDDDLDDESESWVARVRQAAARRSPAVRSEDAANHRQWLILAGQVAGAAVAGMLLFKGFEKMWDVLPFVALILAMIVILGLVALVRVLRRTDDITSTVIAVAVGSFVTLGPLAFLLSTN